MSANVARWTAHLGDLLQIEVGLLGIEEILPGAQVEAFVLNGDGIETTLTGASVSDLEEKIVSVPLATWLADNATVEDTYELKIRLNNVTWPEKGRAQIKVEPRNRNA